MNAESLDLLDSTFDVVCGTAISYHLDLSRALPGIARVLRPGGTAVFWEPLGHNPIIRLYRALTPTMRTPDEHPLRVADLRFAQRYFGEVRTTSFHLLSLAAVPLRRWRIFGRVFDALEGLDAAVFRTFPY